MADLENAYIYNSEPEKKMTPAQGYLAYRIHNFSPAWFSMTMGVGIAGNILYSFPFPLSSSHERLHKAGLALTIFDMILFVMCSVLLAARYCTHGARREWHVGQSMFLGCVPMGFCTIVNMISNQWSPIAGYVMWWISVAVSLIVTAGIGAHGVSAGKEQGLSDVTAMMILPIVSLVVSAATGGVVATNPLFPHALKASTLVVSLLMWGCGIGLALLCMAVYLCRLVVTGLPPKGMVLSNLLFVGPMGQGSFSIMVLGELFADVFKTPDKDVSSVMEISVIQQFSGSAVLLASFVSICFTAIGLFWITFTIIAILFRTGPPPTYNQSFWALTFPMGTFTMAWIKLGEIFASTTLKVIGAAFGAFVIASVLGCLIASIRYGILDDALFKQAEAEMDRA